MDSSTLPCFHCVGSVHPRDTVFHPKGILRRGHFQKFVSNDIDPGAEDNSFVFFGCDYVDDVSVERHLSTIFQIARQKIARMHRCVYKSDTKFSGETSERFWILRKEICRFFVGIRKFVRRKLSCHEKQREMWDIIRQLLKYIRDLVLYMATMNNLPPHIISCMASSQGNRILSLTYHFAHMNLDVRWSLVLLLSDLSPLLERNPHLFANLHFLPQTTIDQLNLDGASPFEQYIFFILWDFVGISLNIFRKLQLSEYSVITPFPCCCFKELAVLLVKLLDRLSERDGKDSFWITLHRIIQVILPEKEVPIHEVNENDCSESVHIDLIPTFFGNNKLGFCWWLLFHFTPLYEIDDHGNIDRSNQAPYRSNYFEVTNLCRLATQCELYSCTESQLRCYLRCALSVCDKWETSMEAPLLLWEYFYKRLNDLFMDAGELTVPGHGKSGLALFKHLQTLTKDPNASLDNFTSYQLFLRFLSLQLQRSLSSGSQKEWKYLKGRIFSKFHPRKMKELNVSGLHNCFCLFLSVASLTDLGDVADKICDLLEMINPSILEQGKHSIIWRVLFALMLIFEQEGKDLAVPAQQMANNFHNYFGSEQSRHSSVSMQSHFATELLNIYMEGLQDIFEHSKELNLSEYVLIATSFQEVLIDASSSDIQIALSAVEIILSRVKIAHHKRLLVANGSGETSGGSLDFRHLEALADAIWVHVLPFVKEQVLGEAHYKLLAEVATGITLLMLDTPPNPVSPVKETFSSLVEDFGFNLQARAEFCCEYLTNLLSRPNLLEQTSAVSEPNFQAKFIRAWIRLGIQIPQNAMHDLTRLVFRLPEIKKVFADAQLELPSTDKYGEVLKSFLKALTKRQNTMEFNSRIAAKQTVAFYFADIMKVTNINFTGSNSSDMLSAVYLVVGSIIETIPSLIYVASKHDCIFCEIVNATILPHTIYNPESQIHQNLLDTIRDHLPQLIVGISSLNYRRDPYIKQTLKNIFTHYLPRFSLKGTGTSVHPLVVSLLTARRCRANGLDVVNFAFEVVKDAYLIKRGNALNMGINFIHELLICCSPKDCSSTSATLLPALLKLMLLLEESLPKQRVSDVVKLLITSSFAQDDESCRSSVEEAVKDVVRQHFSSHTDRMFTLLRTLAKLYLNTVGSLLPFIAEQVSETERKQGSGTNGALRSKLRQFALDVEAGFTATRSLSN